MNEYSIVWFGWWSAHSMGAYVWIILILMKIKKVDQKLERLLFCVCFSYALEIIQRHSHSSSHDRNIFTHTGRTMDCL